VADIKDLKARTDLHQLAEFLGLKRGKGNNANYHSPHHSDSTPSLAIDKHGTKFNDYSANGTEHSYGDALDLIQWVEGIDLNAAIDLLHEFHGLERTPPETPNKSSGGQSLPEFIASKSSNNTDKAIDYLHLKRGIPKATIEKYLSQGKKIRSIGFNDYRSKKIPEGDTGHGGPAVMFIARGWLDNKIRVCEMRYIDDGVLNGGVKAQTQGDQLGVFWTPCRNELKRAHTVYIVESPINALSIHACDMPGVAALAVLGSNNIEGTDWNFLAESMRAHDGKISYKRVVIAMDRDESGKKAAWLLHEILLGLNVATFLVNQDEWEKNDVNDFIKGVEPEKQSKELIVLKTALKNTDEWLIPGKPGNSDLEVCGTRVYLPPHDFGQYWRFRSKADFMTTIKTVKRKTKEGDELEEDITTDVCGFRVAGISNIQIASAKATMTGEEDNQPHISFAITAQTPRHGNKLVRRVIDDEKLHNVGFWEKFGPIYAPQQFKRAVNILERTAHIGSRQASNFVGLCWRDQKLVVNEGKDTYFTDPERQCPYHNLKFPSGTKSDAKRVIEAYKNFMQDHAALSLLVWGLGSHLKAVFGFWPHCLLQASKNSGKTTLTQRLERSLGFKMFSGQSLQTEFRLLTCVSHTSHPVGWEELSARSKKVIDKAVSLLQESYNHTITSRGGTSGFIEYVVSSPVLLAGEDVPVDSLLGKVVRTDITAKKGELPPVSLPRFPVKQWLDWLAAYKPGDLLDVKQKWVNWCNKHSRAASDDRSASRIIENYAALLATWQLMCEWTGLPRSYTAFHESVLKEMNRHISETKSQREPWVWIMEIFLGEVNRGAYHAPHKIDTDDDNAPLLNFKTKDVMHHLSASPALKDQYNALTIKSPSVFKKQLIDAGVVRYERRDMTINQNRYCHLIACDVEKLEEFGIEIHRDGDDLKETKIKEKEMA